MSEENSVKKVPIPPKVYQNDSGESCHGFEAGIVKIPVSLISAMTKSREYKNDQQAREFLKDMVKDHFVNSLADFEDSLDGLAIVETFKTMKVENDGRKDRKASAEKVKTLENEVETLRKQIAAMSKAAAAV